MSYSEQYTVGSVGQLIRLSTSEYDKDPRGIVWIWEPPINGATYVMGVDPTVGITGWNRYSRVNSDKKTNNGAIEILRVGNPTINLPDKQVCEFAAPVDPTDLGFIANVLGRLYKGKEDDQCLCIGEITGPGSSTLRAMTERGYLNHWMWQYYGDLIPTESRKVWWSATPTSLKDLWIKCSRHVTRKQVLVKSPWLAEECVDARYDPDRMYAYSPNNFKGHGDRMRAFYLALWGANGWSMELERTQEAVSTQAEVVDPQLTDMSMEEMYDRWGGMTW